MEILVKGFKVSFVETNGSVEIVAKKDGMVVNAMLLTSDEQVINSGNNWCEDVNDILNNSNFDSLVNKTLDIEQLLSDLTDDNNFSIQNLSTIQYENFIKLLDILSKDETMTDILVEILNSRVDNEDMTNPKVRSVIKPHITLIEKNNFIENIRIFDKGRSKVNDIYYILSKPHIIDEVERLPASLVFKVVDILEDMGSMERSSIINLMQSRNPQPDSVLSNIINRFVA